MGLAACGGSVQTVEPRHFVPSTISPVALLDFDIVSYGADATPGGTDENEDVRKP